jgi:anti-sigma-K factor RskA
MTELDDIDALAGEYVLGTLSRDERRAAATRRETDKALDAAIEAWERRLGPLVDVVPPVAPPPNLYSKIRAQIGLSAHVVSLKSREMDLARRATRWKRATIGMTALAASLLGIAGWREAAHRTELRQQVAALESAKVWHQEVLATKANEIAELRAATEKQVAEVKAATAKEIADLKTRTSKEIADLKAAQAAMPTQYVAVLQATKDSPAFLMTVDTKTHMCVISAIAAPEQAGKSYEVWMVSDKIPKPKSLGVYEEGDMRPMPMDGGPDADLFMNATFAVSLEPEGGSPTGGPTGPVLFTGKLVQATP